MLEIPPHPDSENAGGLPHTGDVGIAMCRDVLDIGEALEISGAPCDAGVEGGVRSVGLQPIRGRQVFINLVTSVAMS